MKKNYVAPETHVIQADLQLLDNFSVSNSQTDFMGAKKQGSSILSDGDTTPFPLDEND